MGAILTLREAYDFTYGLYTADAAKDPMSVMKMHPHEDFVTDGSVMDLMNRIITAKLPGLTGMSLIDLMEMPPSLLEPLLKTANKKVKDEAAAAENLLTDLEE